MMDNKAKTVEELLEELNRIDGLEEVKRSVGRLVNRIKVGAKGNLHMAFLGDTQGIGLTVAQILGQIYKQLGVLENGECHAYARQDLVGEFVGQTTLKTGKCIEQAMGGIFFVDAAYTICEGQSDYFGMEALDSILFAMEKHKDDMVFIFSGETEKMEAWFGAYAGLISRVPNVLSFK